MCVSTRFARFHCRYRLFQIENQTGRNAFETKANVCFVPSTPNLFRFKLNAIHSALATVNSRRVESGRKKKSKF